MENWEELFEKLYYTKVAGEVDLICGECPICRKTVAPDHYCTELEEIEPTKNEIKAFIRSVLKEKNNE